MSQTKLIALEQTRRVAHALSSAAELMAGQLASANVKDSTFDVVSRITSPLVLKCTFGKDSPALLVIAAHEAWSAIADASVSGAGIETADDDFRQETWRELISQALTTLVSGQIRDLTVTPATTDEMRTVNPSSEFACLELILGEGILPPFFLVWDQLLLGSLGLELSNEGKALSGSTSPAALDRLLDIELPLSVSFGKTHLAVQDVLKLSTGSIIELNCTANDLVEIVVNNCMIARGEVVVIEGNYGVRIRDIVSRGDRLALQNSRGSIVCDGRRLSA